LQTGELAGLAVLGWYASTSWILGRGAAETLLVLAESFFRPASLSGNIWLAFSSGAALHLVAAGLVGAVYGIAACRLRRSRSATLLGLLFGVGWYCGWHLVLRPPNRDYFLADRTVLLGHLLFGILLSRCRAVWTRMAAETGSAGGDAPPASDRWKGDGALSDPPGSR